jgi:hypothetical protein
MVHHFAALREGRRPPGVGGNCYMPTAIKLACPTTPASAYFGGDVKSMLLYYCSSILFCITSISFFVQLSQYLFVVLRSMSCQ